MKLSTEEIARRMGEVSAQMADLSQELKGLQIQLLMAIDRNQWGKKLP